MCRLCLYTSVGSINPSQKRFKEKSAGTADILFSHLGQKTHGFPATISTFGRCPKSLWSSTWVCLNPNMGALSKREHEDSPFPGCSSSNFGFTKNMEMSWNMSVSHAWESTSPAFLCSVSIPTGRQVHNGRAMRNPEMVPGRAMFPSRCEKRRGALSMAWEATALRSATF